MYLVNINLLVNLKLFVIAFLYKKVPVVECWGAQKKYITLNNFHYLQSHLKICSSHKNKVYRSNELIILESIHNNNKKSNVVMFSMQKLLHVLCAWLTDISSALQLLEHIQLTINQSGDAKLQAQTADDLNFLISSLENPILRSIVSVQVYYSKTSKII